MLRVVNSLCRLHSELIWLDKKRIRRQKGYDFNQRIMDLFLSCVGIVLISPIMFWVSYKIHKDDPKASVIFKQKRVGRNGKPFTMYKFRSMCVDAEEQLEEFLDQNEIKGTMFKIKEDPRITGFGKFIDKPA